MKAIIYKIIICESTLELVHGGGSAVDELYIPSLNLFINNVACFVEMDKTQVMFRIAEIKEKKEFDIPLELEEKFITLAKLLVDKQKIHKFFVEFYDLKGGE